MLTISSIIHTNIQSNPFIAEALQKNLINISELARIWHTEVEQKTKKQITLEALSMAIRRAIPQNTETNALTQLIKPLQTTLRSGLIERSFQKTPTSMRSYKRLTDTLDLSNDTFITLSMGMQEITIIADYHLETLITVACKEEQPTASLNNLAAIILKLPDQVINTPGSYYTYLGKLTWQGINIEEVISTAHELIVIVQEEVSHDAFKILTK